MKTSTFLLAVSLLIVLSACDRNSVAPSPVIESPLIGLFYDGNNQDAPLLQGGRTYEAGVRFPQSELGNASGGTAETIYLYIQDLPESCSVKLYANSSDNTPENLLYSAVISSDIEENSWHAHEVGREVILPDEDIWVVVQFSHAFNQQTLGCDPGPAAPDGDWLLDSNDGDWLPLVQRAPGVNINWNIRLAVQPI
ncbi:MAG: hypothetical protein AAF399_17235 [Bacteroidota bacterium]